MASNRTIVSLDDLNIRALAKHDPVLFFQRYRPPLLIDKIQYAPELLPYIKMIVDKEKQNGMFWLTGSQAFHLMKNVSESLAGRVGIVELLGLSTNESKSEPYQSDPQILIKRIQEKKKMTSVEIFERIFKGSMPRLYDNSNVDWEMYYSAYMNTYIQRDIRDLTQVADETQFMNFMCVVVVLVQPYHNNRLKRVVKMPLLHFLDTGLCAFLLKWSSPEILEKGAMAGQFFETYVFSEIYKSFLNEGKIPPIYYYRDKQKKKSTCY